MFKGIIGLGSQVRVTFSADFSNSGPSHLAVGLAPLAGEPKKRTGTVAAGGQLPLTIEADSPGLLDVDVDVTDEDDAGVLRVEEDGAELHNEPIQGDKTWRYSVQ